MRLQIHRYRAPSSEPLALLDNYFDTGFSNGDVPAKERKEEDGHAELEALITFQCESPSTLKDLDVKLFNAFPPLHRLQVQMVGPRGQSATTLTPKRHVLSW